MKFTISTILFLIFNCSLLCQDSNNFEKPKRGLYKTFKEYKSGNPSRDIPFKIKEEVRTQKNWEGTVSYLPVRIDNGQIIDRIWGYSDGENFYIKYAADYFPVEYKDGKLKFWGYKHFFEKDMSKELFLLRKMNSYRITKVEYEIDTNTGVSYILEPELETETNIILYRSQKEENNHAIDVEVNKEIKVNLASNSIGDTIYWGTKKDSLLKCCYGEAFEQCDDVKIEIGKTNFIKCSWKENTNKIEVYKVKRQTGEFEMAKIKNAEKKRRRKEKKK